MTIKQKKAFIKEVFSEVLENIDPNPQIYAKYFSADYLQYVDGKCLDFSLFVKHMQIQKSVMTNLKINFARIVCEGDTICTIHYVDGIKNDGGVIKAKVIAFFKLKNNKIIVCDELTYLIEGDASDKDLGSRH